MSVIDERIVQMKFDNHLFEKNVNTSISTLDKLKSALKFDNVQNNFKDLSNSVNNIDFSRLANSVDSLSGRFSAFGIAGMTVIQDLTHAAEGLASTLISSTIGQISSGGWARATNIDKAKFAIEGLGYDFKDLDGSISKAVNDTRFGYDEAATAASQLVASNVQIGEEMDNALKSIANVASQTNSSYSEIGHIYTTIAGNGKLMTEQLNMFSYRGMNAAAMMAKVWNTTESEVRTMVTKGQVDFKKFSDAMNEYLGDGAKRANQTFEGSLANMKAALSRVGQPFAESIRKHAVPVFNTLKEVIKDVKGRIEPLTVLFEDFATKASNLFVDIFGNIDLSWIDKLVDGLKGAYDYFDKIMTMITPLWGKVAETDEATASALDSMAKSEEEITEVANKVIANLYGSGEERRQKLEEEGYIYEEVQNKVNELLGCTKRYEVAEKEATKAVEENTEAQESGYEVSKKVYQNYAKQQKELAKSKERQAKLDKLTQKLAPTAEGAASAVNILKNTVSAVVEGGFDPMFNILTSGASIILDVVGAIGKMVTALDEYLTKSGFYQTLQEGINTLLTDTAGFVESIAESVNKFVSEGGGLDRFLKIFTDTPQDGEKLADSMKSVHDVFKEFFSTLLDFILGDGADGLNGIVDTLTTLVPILGKLQPLVAGLIGDFLAVKGAGAISSIFDSLKTVPKYLKSLANENNADALLKVAEAFGILAIAMFVFANLSWDQIARGATAIGAIAVALGGLFVAIEKFSQFKGENDITSIVGTFTNSLANDNNGDAILKIAGAVAILAAAFWGLSTISWDGIARATVAIAGLAAVLVILWYAFNKFSQFKGKNDITSIAGTFANSLANNNNATAILKLAGAVAILAAAFWGLAQLSWDQIARGAVAIGVLTVALTALMFVMNKTKKTVKKSDNPLQGLTTMLTDIGKGLKSMFSKIGLAALIASLAAVVLSIGHVIIQLSKIPFKKGLDAVKLMGLVLLELVAAVFLINKTGGGSFKNAALMAAIGFTVKSIGSTLEILSGMSLEKGLQSVLLLGVVLFELWAALALIGGGKSSGAFGKSVLLAAIALTVNMIGDALVQLSELPFASGLKAVGLLGLVLLELWAALALIGGGGKSTGVLGKAAMMIALATTVNMLQQSIKTLSEIPFEKAMTAVIALGAVLLELSIALKIIGSGGQAAVSIGTMLGITAVISAMAGAIWVLSTIDSASLAKAVLAIAAVGAILLGFMALASLISGGGVMGAMTSLTSVLPMIAMLLSVVAALYILSTIPAEKLESSINAIMDVFVALSLMFAGMSLLSFGNPLTIGVAFLGIGAILAEVAIIFAKMEALDPEHMLSVSEAMAKVIDSLATISLAAAALNLTGGPLGGLIGGLNIGVLLAFIVGIEALAAKINSDHPEFQAFLDKGIPLLEKIAEGIGRFFGKIFTEGLLKPIKDTFGDVPGQLSDFMNQMQPVLTGMEDMDTKGLDQIKEILKKIASIEAEGLLAGVLRMLGGENSLLTFASDMNTFAVALNTYCETLKNGAYDQSVVESTTGAMDMLTELANSVPDEGLLSKLFDETDFGQFADDLVPFAEGMNSFCSEIATGNFDEEAAKKAAAAGEVLAAFAKEIPESSLLDKLSGQTELTRFADSLPNLATKLGWYCQNLSTSGFDSDAIDKSNCAAQMLVGFAKEIPDSSLLGKLTGGLLGDISVFANQLPGLATGLGEYCKNLSSSGFDSNAITESNAAVEMLLSFTKEIPNEGGLLGWLTGEKDRISRFSEVLPKLATGLGDFCTALDSSGFDSKYIRKSKAAIEMILEFTKDLPEGAGDTGGILGWFIGTDLDLTSFGTQLKDFGAGIAGFAEEVSGITGGDLTNSANAVGMVRDLVGIFNELIGLTGENANVGDTLTGLWNYNDIAHAVSGFFAELANAFTDTGGDIASLHETMNTVGSDIIGWIQEGLEQSASTDGATSTITAIGQAVADGLGSEETLATVKENAEALGEQVMIALENLVGENGELAQFTDLVTDAFEEMIETSISYLSAVVDDMEMAGSQWGNGIANGLKGKIGAIKSACSNLGNGALSTLRSFTQGMTTIGNNWAGNIVSGLNASASSVTTAATRIGTSAGQAFNTAYQTTTATATAAAATNTASGFKPGQGPQGDMIMESGKEVGEKLIEGIGEAVDNSSTEFAEQVGTMVSFANAAMAEELNTNPIITPVLDLTDIRNGSTALDNLIGNSGFSTNSKGISSYASALLDNVGGYSSYNLQDRLNTMATINTINGIRSDIKDLGNAMSHMQLVMNNGALVGQIGNTMDRQLGSIQKFKERWA